MRLIKLLCFVIFCSSCAHAQVKLPEIFADSMVLQRDMPLPVWGTAKENSRITIRFNGTTAVVRADKQGNWAVTLPASKAGGPFSLVVSDKQSAITLTDVLVGEVWLCSGQSNMEWTLQQSKNGKDEIRNAKNLKLRFFRMTAKSELRPTANRIYDAQAISRLKQAGFYEQGKWETSSSASASKFSAVGYYFGKAIQKELDVPVGLILNAVGGTTTQAFISAEALRSHPQLTQFAGGENGKTWLQTAKDIHPWVLERTRENLQNHWEQATASTLSPHPFGPSLLHDAGIKPLVPFAIRGVIWYQGESNATHPQIHDALFTTMVNSWRTEWKQGDFPFYFVQLPGISNRSRWPEFRESQRRLSENLVNTGMAVTIDAGDSLDVHPGNKKIVGDRLARIALAKTYGKPVIYSGPVLESYERHSNEIHLMFRHAQTLLTNNEKPVSALILEGYSQGGTRMLLVEPKNVRTEKNKLIISIPPGLLLTGIKYAWALWPHANLINEAGLPASPFKLELPGNN